MKNETKENIMTDISSLDQIAAIKAEKQKEMDRIETEIEGTWNKIFRQPTEEELKSPTRRAMAWINSSAGMIDGLLLGWKLINRFNQLKRMIK